MKLEITATEAWQAVERLRLDVTHNRKTNNWCASIYEPRVEIGWGDTPVEAVAQLLERVGAVNSKSLLAELQETNAEIQRLVGEVAIAG